MSRTQQATAQPQPQAGTVAAAQKQFDPESAILDDIMERTVSNLDKWAEKFSGQLEDPNIGGLRRAFITGLGVKRMRDMMDSGVMQVLRSLMNTPIGFMTDRGPGKKEASPYPDDVLRDCAIEATLKGVSWVGNQFNIIAGRCYLTLEGYTRKLDNTRGLEHYAAHPGVPRNVDANGAIVRYNVTWKYKGVKGELIDPDGKPGVDIAVKKDSYSGVDQILGKARRKAFKLAYDTIHNIKDTEPDDVDMPEVSPADPQCITDRQEADLNAAIAEHVASAILIRDRYKLTSTQRLLIDDFADCMARIKAGEFSAPKASDAAGVDNGDAREYSADEITEELTKAGADICSVCKRYGVKRVADLTPVQRVEIIDELGQAVGA